MAKRSHTETFEISTDGRCGIRGMSSEELGDEGRRLARKVRRLLNKKIAGYSDRAELEANGRYVMKRLCATYPNLDGLPFRYTTSEIADDDTRVMYAVFDGYTAIVRADMDVSPSSISVLWETQEPEARGWIGVAGALHGRGNYVYGLNPIEIQIGKLRGGNRYFFWKLFLCETGQDRSLLDELSLCDKKWGLRGRSVPILQLGVDEKDDAILFDGVPVCVRGSCPFSPADLPEFFAPVLHNVMFWRQLFNDILKNSNK